MILVFVLASLLGYFCFYAVRFLWPDVPFVLSILIYPAVVVIVFVIFYRIRAKKIMREKKEIMEKRKEVRDQFQAELRKLPKVYEFYCSRCLFQTNEDVGVCPSCEEGELVPTSE